LLTIVARRLAYVFAHLSLSKTRLVLDKLLEKPATRPFFPLSKEAVPKTEVLEQSHFITQLRVRGIVEPVAKFGSFRGRLVFWTPKGFQNTSPVRQAVEN
jgi:hypothetical protein